MNIFSNLLSRAKNNPEATFCHFFKGSLYRRYTVREVVSDAIEFAALLRERNVRHGQIVPLVLEHRCELYSSFIGCSLIGAIPTFLSPLTFKQDVNVFKASMSALMQRIKPACVIGSESTLFSINASGHNVINVDLVIPSKRVNLIPANLEFNTTAALQHSSGTTATKKGVCLSHQTILSHVRRYGKAIQLSDQDVIASWLPLYHDMGLITSFLMPAVTGVPVISMDALEWVVQPSIFLDLIERFRATLCWLPNFAFHHIVRLASPNKQWDISSLRMVINCSEPCRAAAFRAFSERFGILGTQFEIFQCSYAMAENVFAVTQTRPGKNIQRSPNKPWSEYVSSGITIDGVQLRVVSEDGLETMQGVLGEIVISGDYLFDGYFAQPELTSTRLKEGWYRTGDIGFLDDENELFVVGRLDDLLNLNGRKIVAHEVENLLNVVPGIAPGRVIVYAQHDHEIGATQLMVAAERWEQTAIDDEKTKAAIRRLILDNIGMRPSYITLLERGALLKSTSGKISRRATIEKLNLLRTQDFPT